MNELKLYHLKSKNMLTNKYIHIILISDNMSNAVKLARKEYPNNKALIRGGKISEIDLEEEMIVYIGEE